MKSINCFSIAEGNKLIAEFMEFEHDEEEFGNYHTEHTYEQAGDCWSDSYSPKDMLFHVSWDWLMPVVLGIRNKGFFFFWDDYVVRITKFQDCSGVISKDSFLGKDMAITAVYNCVVGFLGKVYPLARNNFN